MFRLLLASTLSFMACGVFAQNVDLRLTNIQFPSSGKMTVDVEIKSAGADFTLGANFQLSTSIRVTYDNEGTGAGEMNSDDNTTSNTPSGYAPNNTDNNGYSTFVLFNVGGNLTINSSYQRIGTITYSLGTGTDNTYTVTLGIDENNSTVNNGSGSSLTLNTPTGISNQQLPVELLRFDIKLINDLINITWTTSSEENNEGFEIQRSYDGNEYETIGWVDGYGNRITPVDYSYTDYAVDINAASTVFYRLKQIDFDGNYEFSPVRSLSLTGQQSISWFPNPAKENIVLNTNESALIQVYDMAGRTVLSTDNINSSFIDVSSFEKGTYLMIISNLNGEILSQDKLHIN